MATDNYLLIIEALRENLRLERENSERWKKAFEATMKELIAMKQNHPLDKCYPPEFWGKWKNVP